MIGAVLALTAAYVALAALLLHLNLVSPYRRWIKFSAVAAVTGFYFCAWHGALGLLGWPARGAPADAVRLHAVWVDEPDRGGSRSGGIYFWVRELDAEGRARGEPRAHVLPWDRELAEAAQSAAEELAGGALLDGYFTGSAAEAMRGDARGRGAADRDGPLLSQAEEERPRFEFRRVARPDLPPKPPPDALN